MLDKGRIIEQGSHRALMAQGGHYAELYNAYFRHQSLAYIEQVGAEVITESAGAGRAVYPEQGFSRAVGTP